MLRPDTSSFVAFYHQNMSTMFFFDDCFSTKALMTEIVFGHCENNSTIMKCSMKVLLS